MVRRDRRWRGAVSFVALMLLGAACASGESAPSARPGSTPSATASVSVSVAPPAPPAPAVGSCHALDLEQATQPVDPTRAVKCSRPHTSVTIAVGQIDPVQDGHLLALDSPAVRAQLAEACPSTLPRSFGGSRTTQRLSRLEVVWFGPSLEQADAGANWYRCDVVALRSKGSLLPLPRTMEGVLDVRAPWTASAPAARALPTGAGSSASPAASRTRGVPSTSSRSTLEPVTSPRAPGPPPTPAARRSPPTAPGPR